MRVHLTDPLTVHAAGTLDERSFPGRQARLVFAFLAAERGRPVPRDELAEVLWPDAPPPSWEKALAVVVSRLRSALTSIGLDATGLLVNAFGCYQLRLPEGAWIDVEAAARAFHEAKAKLVVGDPGSAAESAALAASLLRPTFLAGEEGPWVESKRRGLKDLLFGTLDALAEAQLLSGDPAGAAKTAEKLVLLEPFREIGYQRLMRAYTAAGDRAHAVAAYARCRTTLAEELGVDPSAETEAIYLELLRSGTQGAPAAAGPTSAIAPNNLPLLPTTFVGRAAELEELGDLLGAGRLVTITGAGGSGKTRLALEIGVRQLERFPRGVWLADLASVTDLGAVPGAVAAALGVREERGRSIVDAVTTRLAQGPALLILDNCEHLRAPVARLAETLLTSCPNLSILATSRSSIGTDGETRFSLRPLTTPDPDRLPDAEMITRYESVELFLDRVRAAVPGFPVTPAALQAGARICHQLDGIPLAIELAAARARVLGVEQIVERLGDRFRLLKDGMGSRHQTLHATLDWSHELLDEAERILFRRLSIFAGGFEADAAEAVCAGGGVVEESVIDLLSRLVEQSLVWVEQHEGRARHRLLETVREYAHERVAGSGEEHLVRARHLAWCIRIAEPASAAFDGPRQRDAVELMTREHDNLRTALAWATAGGDAKEGLRLAAVLARFWNDRGHWSEGLSWLHRALAGAGPARTEIRARALRGAANLSWRLDDARTARALAEEALAIHRESGDETGTAEGLVTLATTSMQLGDLERARREFEEAIERLRRTDRRRALALALHNLAGVAFLQHNVDTAESRFQESVRVAREAGDTGLVGRALGNLADLKLARGELTGVREQFEEALAIQRRGADATALPTPLLGLGRLCLREGDFDAAEDRSREALRVSADLRFIAAITACLETLSQIAAERGDASRAARLLGAADALREGEEGSPAWWALPYRERAASLAEAALGAGAYRAAWAEGRAMPLDDAVAEACRASPETRGKG